MAVTENSTVAHTLHINAWKH